MPTPPAIPLQRLLHALPIDYPLDNYPPPWDEILTTLQAAPPTLEARKAAFKDAIRSLPDAALGQLEADLNDPLAFRTRHTGNSPQGRLLLALAKLAPTQVGPLARHLNRDYAGIFRSLQKLVSLGLVTRYKDGSRVYYRLPANVPSHLGAVETE